MDAEAFRDGRVPRSALCRVAGSGGGIVQAESARFRPTRRAPPGPGLCQGTALHYVNQSSDVKDLDVWSSYAGHDGWPFPARLRRTRDFGPAKFGRYPGDLLRYSGRRVDLLGRSLPAQPGADAAAVRQRFLVVRRTDSAKALAAKAVVLIDPQNPLAKLFGSPLAT
jgi:hypothetical protein